MKKFFYFSVFSVIVLFTSMAFASDNNQNETGLQKKQIYESVIQKEIEKNQRLIDNRKSENRILRETGFDAAVKAWALSKMKVGLIEELAQKDIPADHQKISSFINSCFSKARKELTYVFVINEYYMFYMNRVNLAYSDSKILNDIGQEAQNKLTFVQNNCHQIMNHLISQNIPLKEDKIRQAIIKMYNQK